MTQPPPWSQCNKCGGELRLKLIETSDRGNEIFVCAKCGGEQSLTVSHNHKMLHIKVA
jgi:hypothetical protein